LREMAGILPATAMTVPDKKESVLAAQLRQSFANVRPGHRITGSVVLGQAGVRLKFQDHSAGQNLEQDLRNLIEEKNTFHLHVQFEKISQNTGQVEFDLILTASSKDPHSGVNGGPFPIAELQIAKIVECIANRYGSQNIETRSLNLSLKDRGRLFDSTRAKAIVEIRIAAGNFHEEAQSHLKSHLLQHVPEGFQLRIKNDKGANPLANRNIGPDFSTDS